LSFIFKKRGVVDSQAAFIHGSRSLPADLSWPLKLALAYQDVIMTYRYKHQKGGKFMALRSQLITKEFPELDRVERLNNEAFPEEERIPLSDFLIISLPFMTRMILLDLPQFSTMPKFFM